MPCIFRHLLVGGSQAPAGCPPDAHGAAGSTESTMTVDCTIRAVPAATTIGPTQKQLLVPCEPNLDKEGAEHVVQAPVTQ